MGVKQVWNSQFYYKEHTKAQIRYAPTNPRTRLKELHRVLHLLDFFPLHFLIAVEVVQFSGQVEEFHRLRFDSGVLRVQHS